MKKTYDLLIFIGRFQPLHQGHKKVINEALVKSDHLLVLVGSAFSARTIRNPFNFSEVKNLIEDEYSANKKNIHIKPLKDFMYNDDLWIQNCQKIVFELVKSLNLDIKKDLKIGIIGHKKDNTSFYLDLFPQWDFIEVEALEGVNSTAIRNYLFSEDKMTHSDGYKFAKELSSVTENFLIEYKKSEKYKEIKKEFDFVQKYQKQWEKAPYRPTFNTVDAVVIQSGHVLVVERRSFPGKGQLALPGGFIDNTETLEEACLRELREETKIKVPLPVLKGSILRVKTFDNPFRSFRGRTITTAFLIKLKDDRELPKTKGNSDAKKTFWLPLGALEESEMFGDHFHIIESLISGQK